MKKTRPSITYLRSTLKWLRFTLLLLLLQAIGCTVGPDFTTPTPPILQSDFAAKQNFHLAEIELDQWWQAFNDPKLNELLIRAQAQNLPLREAYERIVEARANLRLQGGQSKPNDKRSPNSRPFVGSNGDPFNLFDLGFDASWELDLFGRLKRTIEAAEAEVELQTSDYEFIRQTLMADIVNNYLRIRLLQSQAQLAEESLVIQAETSVLVSGRRQAGVSTELDQKQTDSFRFRTEALLASLRRQIEVEFNQLGILMGKSPDLDLRHFVSIMPVPEIPPVPAAGLPADLLRRRPDLWREEWAVKAAGAQIGIAEADLYPQLSLLGTITVSAQNVSGLFETNGLEFSVGPSFSWNILHFNRITNNIEIQQSIMRQALIRYQDTALNAVREVEDALVNHQGYLEQWQAFNKAIANDKRAVALSLERYRAGKTNFQRVLDAQQQLLDDRSQSFDAQAQAIIQLVRLYRASGGSWPTGGGVNYIQLSGQPVVSHVLHPVVAHVAQPFAQTPQQVIVTGQPAVNDGRYPLFHQESHTQENAVSHSVPAASSALGSVHLETPNDFQLPTENQFSTENRSPTESRPSNENQFPAKAQPPETSIIEIPQSPANNESVAPSLSSYPLRDSSSSDLKIDVASLFGSINDIGGN